MDISAVEPSSTTGSGGSAGAAADPAQVGAFEGEIVPAEPVFVTKREELDRVLARHQSWRESVLHPRKKISGGRANLSGACLCGMDLSGVDLSYATLVAVDFEGADLSHANLSGADLTRANLQRAILRGARLTRACLDEADMRGVITE